MSSNDPTPEMIEFFETRTRQHIQRVQHCMKLMAEATQFAEELLERARVHDASKFDPEEHIPYIWLTEYYRCWHRGESLEYPEGMEERIELAKQHHMSHNRHHPEFHADPNDMSQVDLIEMVCDWTAMAQEFDQCGGSAREWADRTVGQRVSFNEQNKQFIYQMIALLDQQLTKG